ncbi:hypothetical protein ACFRKE_11785 [Kitasatospora indigofera]|uniref:hypothetical protein n=1 Tax=Kitasatospora indigofera TaxID=67307 RepID=UPI00362D072F
MYVLVPDDPVFFAKFQSLEDLLLRCLYVLQVEGVDSEEARLVADAYDSWVRVLLKLPLWSRRREDATDLSRTDYKLYAPGGAELTSLYPVELAVGDVEQLWLCLRVLRDSGAERPAAPLRAAGAAGTAPEHLIGVFRRVVGVLLLPAPPELMRTLRQVLSGAPAVTLGHREEAQYRRYCATVVRLLSSGDGFGYRNHLAIYR